MPWPFSVTAKPWAKKRTRPAKPAQARIFPVAGDDSLPLSRVATSRTRPIGNSQGVAPESASASAVPALPNG